MKSHLEEAIAKRVELKEMRAKIARRKAKLVEVLEWIFQAKVEASKKALKDFMDSNNYKNEVDKLASDFLFKENKKMSKLIQKCFKINDLDFFLCHRQRTY